MRILVFSDLHGNLEMGERAVAAARSAGGFDKIWFLGDALGTHNPDYRKLPFCECLEWLRENEARCVRGNWEQWVLNAEAPRSNQLSWESQLQYLRDLLGTRPDLWTYIEQWKHTEMDENTLLCHANPRLDEYEYESPIEDAWLWVKENWNVRIFTCGHTHIPSVHYVYAPSLRLPAAKAQWPVRWGESRVLEPPRGHDVWLTFNPGSLSDPRSRDLRRQYTALLVEFVPELSRVTLTCLGL